VLDSRVVMDPKNSFFGSRRGYHHGSLKDALVEAARRIISERGSAAFTLAEAAKLAGVTAAAPYRHFSDRQALMSELARRGFEMFDKRLSAAWDAGRPDPQRALLRMGTAYLAFARDEPGLYGAMFGNVGALAAPASGAAATKALEGLRQATSAVLRMSGGSEAAARKLAFEIWSLSHGIAMLVISGHLDPTRDKCDPAALLETATLSLVEGARHKQ
jgi:AcrR family transcriptional regulator